MWRDLPVVGTALAPSYKHLLSVAEMAPLGCSDTAPIDLDLNQGTVLAPGWRSAEEWAMEEWAMGVARIALAKGCCIEVGCLDMSAHGSHQRGPDSAPHA